MRPHNARTCRLDEVLAAVVPLIIEDHEPGPYPAIVIAEDTI